MHRAAESLEIFGNPPSPGPNAPGPPGRGPALFYYQRGAYNQASPTSGTQEREHYEGPAFSFSYLSALF